MSLLSLCAVLLLAGCSTSSTEDSTYRIGVIVSQTGSASQLGVGELQGAQLAADTINAKGGVQGRKIELVVTDDQSTPVQAVMAARRMVGNVDAIIGPSVASTCNATAPLAEASKTVLYCLSAGFKPKPDSYIWTSSVSTEDAVGAAVDHWAAEGITKVGLLYSTDASGVEGMTSLRSFASDRPDIQVAEASFEPGAVSVTSQLQSLIAQQPQALIVWSTGAGAAVAFKGIDQLHLGLPVATTHGNLSYAFVGRITDYLPDRLLIPATQDFWWQDSDRPAPAAELEATYHQDFQDRFGYPPDLAPGLGFDAMNNIADALTRTNGANASLKKALQTSTGIVGVAGTYNFSPQNHRGLDIDDVAMVRLADGGFVPETKG